MTTITLKINERTKKGKAFLEFSKQFLYESKEIELIQRKSKATSLTNLEVSLNEVKNGNINTYKSVDDFFNKVIN